MKIRNFFGIDVSKGTLDICIWREGQILRQLRITNTVKDIKRTFDRLRKDGFTIEESIICIEHTGIYNNLLLNYFNKTGYVVWVESARQIKLSLGMVRGKSDRIDAVRIAQYAYKNQASIKVWQPKRGIIQMLQALLKNRERLLKIKNQLTVSVQESKSFISKEIFQLTEQINKKPLSNVKKALTQLDEKILQLIKSDSVLLNQYRLSTSVDGVGPVTAVTVITKANEFKDFSDGRKFACQAGVAPFEHTSGKSIRGRTRVSHMADKSLKTLFHLAALAVIKKGEYKVYYERKVAAGKNKMLVINAIRNKIIQRIFAVVKRGTPYQKFNNFDFGKTIEIT